MTHLDTIPAAAIAPVTQWFNLAGREFPVYAGEYECRYVASPQNIMLMKVVIGVDGGLRITVGEPLTYRYYDTNNMMCVAFGVLDDAIEWRGLVDKPATPTAVAEFYIVSSRHTRRDAPYISFWGPNDAGYRWALSGAGKYSRERVESHLSYYCSGESTFAVPCAAADPMGVAPAPRTVDNDAGPVVPNTAANRRALIEANAFPTSKPIEFEWFSRKKGRLGSDIYNCAGCGRFVSDNQRFSGNCANCGTDNRP